MKHEKHEQQKVKVRKLLSSAHRKYLTRILNVNIQDSPKSFWSYIKSQKADNTGVSPIRHEGKLYSDSKSKAQLLSDQFKSVFTQENKSSIPNPPGDPYPAMEDIHIDEAGVKKLLDRIKPGKAHGPDNT